MFTLAITCIAVGVLVLALWLKRKKTMDYPQEIRLRANSNAFRKME